MSLRTVYAYPSDGEWGDFDEKSNQITGILGEIYRAEADFAPTNYLESLERHDFVDFSYRIGETQ